MPDDDSRIDSKKSGQDRGSASSCTPGDASTSDSEKPGQDRERTRSGIAMALLGALALVFASSIVAVIAGAISAHDLQELSSFVAPLVVLAGSVTAFYFGRTGR
jgi:hypothetical protein